MLMFNNRGAAEADHPLHSNSQLGALHRSKPVVLRPRWVCVTPRGVCGVRFSCCSGPRRAGTSFICFICFQQDVSVSVSQCVQFSHRRAVLCSMHKCSNTLIVSLKDFSVCNCLSESMSLYCPLLVRLLLHMTRMITAGTPITQHSSICSIEPTKTVFTDSFSVVCWKPSALQVQGKQARQRHKVHLLTQDRCIPATSPLCVVTLE